MAFTTWSALKTAVLDGLANGSVLTSSYTINGRVINFRNLKEVTDFLKFIDQQIAAGNNSGRTYAKFMNADD
jgi:hypothetical protein